MNSETRRPVEYGLLFAKGMGMGAADVVPGVSGGTIAFITGIYEELLDSIKSVDGDALKLLLRFDIAGLWKHVNGNFLLCLFAGILTSILSLAHLVSYLLENHPILLNGFFIGLILASTLLVARQVGRWLPAGVVLFALGVVLVVWLGGLRPAEVEMRYHWVFLAGSIAICAMILPGISGSFILLLIGMYGPVITAIKEFDIAVAATFAAGCALGLMLFVRLLSWLLKHFHDALLSLLCGVLLGSVWILWPWKSGGIEIEGKDLMLASANVLPEWGAGQSVVAASLLALTGFLLVYGLERLGKTLRKY